MATQSTPSEAFEPSIIKSLTGSWFRGVMYPVRIGVLWWARWLCLECGVEYKREVPITLHFIATHLLIQQPASLKPTKKVVRAATKPKKQTKAKRASP